MADADPIATLDRQLVEDPYAPGFDELRSVASDLLQARGHIRGEIIAFELLLEQAQRQGRDAHGHALATFESWIADHEARIFGGLAPMRHKLGAMRYEFRGGRVFDLFIDTRRVIMPSHLAEGYRLTVEELTAVILATPLARHLHRLRVRVRTFPEAAKVLAAVRKQASKLALEQLSISISTRPLGHYPASHRHDVVALRRDLGQLWFATESSDILPLLERDLPDEVTAAELEGVEVGAMTRELRVRLGRALTSNRPETTRIACEKIAELGESGRVFASAIELLLRPGASTVGRWIIPVLPRFPAWVRELEPKVRSITGSRKHDPHVVAAAQSTLRHMPSAG